VAAPADPVAPPWSWLKVGEAEPPAPVAPVAPLGDVVVPGAPLEPVAPAAAVEPVAPIAGVAAPVVPVAAVGLAPAPLEGKTVVVETSWVVGVALAAGVEVAVAVGGVGVVAGCVGVVATAVGVVTGVVVVAARLVAGWISRGMRATRRMWRR
jgi:hypothetical protein